MTSSIIIMSGIPPDSRDFERDLARSVVVVIRMGFPHLYWFVWLFDLLNIRTRSGSNISFSGVCQLQEFVKNN